MYNLNRLSRDTYVDLSISQQDEEVRDWKKIWDNPSYDPLWQNQSPEKYLYVPFSYSQRDQCVPEMFNLNGMSVQKVRQVQLITANIPRIVCDFPFYKVSQAAQLQFNHNYFLKRRFKTKTQRRYLTETDSLQK